GADPSAGAGHRALAIAPRDVPGGRKVTLLRRADAVARGLDPRIQQVTATYAESIQDVVVANSDGLFRTDRRVRLNLAIHVVARAGEVLESGFESLRGTNGFEVLTDEAVAEAARMAARRAVRNVGAEAAAGGTYTV